MHYQKLAIDRVAKWFDYASIGRNIVYLIGKYPQNKVWVAQPRGRDEFAQYHNQLAHPPNILATKHVADLSELIQLKLSAYMD